MWERSSSAFSAVELRGRTGIEERISVMVADMSRGSGNRAMRIVLARALAFHLHRRVADLELLPQRLGDTLADGLSLPHGLFPHDDVATARHRPGTHRPDMQMMRPHHARDALDGI